LTWLPGADSDYRIVAWLRSDHVAFELVRPDLFSSDVPPHVRSENVVELTDLLR
jgi:hypothetical protein